ncbi:MAG: SDR family oxidoreductase [Acidimicrobiia bacterium]
MAGGGGDHPTGCRRPRLDPRPVEARRHQKFLDTTTSRTPLRRWAVPGDFGPAAGYLADPRVAYHTGDVPVIDGGYTIF